MCPLEQTGANSEETGANSEQTGANSKHMLPLAGRILISISMFLL